MKEKILWVTLVIFLSIFTFLAYTTGQLKEVSQRKDNEIIQFQAWKENVEKSFINLNKNLSDILGNFDGRIKKLEK